MVSEKDEIPVKNKIARGCMGVLTLYLLIPLIFALWLFIGYEYDQYFKGGEYFYSAKGYFGLNENNGIWKTATDQSEYVTELREKYFLVFFYVIAGLAIAWKGAEYIFNQVSTSLGFQKEQKNKK